MDLLGINSSEGALAVAEEIVPEEWAPGASRPTYTLVLRSRVAVVGNRRVQISEMTASEIAWLKAQRIGWFIAGALIGALPPALAVGSLLQICPV